RSSATGCHGGKFGKSSDKAVFAAKPNQCGNSKYLKTLDIQNSGNYHGNGRAVFFSTPSQPTLGMIHLDSSSPDLRGEKLCKRTRQLRLPLRQRLLALTGWSW